MKSHYRGHKISVWLNLIPQLHQPGLGVFNVQHHHFQEESLQYYDGKQYFFKSRKYEIRKKIMLKAFIYFFNNSVISFKRKFRFTIFS